ncbi:MAG: hypothetical protein Q9193_005493 [Seirophora villosa]
MTRLSPRLSAKLTHLNHILPQSTSRHVCLQCRYRASLQQVPSRPLAAASYFSPLHHRTYATSRVEQFQENLSQGIQKRIFKDDEVPPRDGDRDPPLDTVPVDDVDYKPAVSGEELERVGGPSGWWEEAWDAEHKFAGYMRPTPRREPIEIQAAIRRALVEAVVLHQAPRGSPLRPTTERLLQEAGHTTWNTKLPRSKRRHLEMNFRRRSNVPAIDGFSVSQAEDGEIKLEWTWQEDRDKVYAFLETSAREGILKEPEEERTDEMKAGEEVDLTKQEDREKYLSSPETSAQESIVAEEPDDSAVDQSEEAQVPKDWDAPEEGEVGTERATGELLASAGLVSLDPTERLSMEMETKKKAFHDFEGVIKLSDGAIKFAVIKRAMQLSGTRIPDPAIQSIETINDLYREMTQKPKTKKLADHLTRPRNGARIQLTELSNVELLPTRYRHSMAEAALGRQKVIEKRLSEHGIQEPWKDAMEQIEAYERRRLQRHQNRSSNRGSEFDSLGGAAEGDALVGDVMDHGPIESNVIDRAPIEADPIEPARFDADPIEPDSIEPDPIKADPIEADPIEPATIEPDSIKLDTIESESIEPAAMKSDPNQSDLIEPDPIEPDPIESDPIELDPIEPAAVEPNSNKLDLIETVSIEQAPIEPDTVKPDFIKPDPTESDSIEPAAIESDPNKSDLIETESVEPDSIKPDPIDSESLEPAAIESDLNKSDLSNQIPSDPSNEDSPVSERHPDDSK